MSNPSYPVGVAGHFILKGCWGSAAPHSSTFAKSRRCSEVLRLKFASQVPSDERSSSFGKCDTERWADRRSPRTSRDTCWTWTRTKTWRFLARWKAEKAEKQNPKTPNKPEADSQPQLSHWRSVATWILTVATTQPTRFRRAVRTCVLACACVLQCADTVGTPCGHRRGHALWRSRERSVLDQLMSRRQTPFSFLFFLNLVLNVNTLRLTDGCLSKLLQL